MPVACGMNDGAEIKVRGGHISKLLDALASAMSSAPRVLADTTVARSQMTLTTEPVPPVTETAAFIQPPPQREGSLHLPAA